MISSHEEYQRLGKTYVIREQQYYLLFCGTMEDPEIIEIREATNKAWLSTTAERREEHVILRCYLCWHELESEHRLQLFKIKKNGFPPLLRPITSA